MMADTSSFISGQYSLVEPDGSVRTVDYTADDVHGFNAVVSKTAPTIHHVEKQVVHAPIVHAPIVHAPVVKHIVQAPHKIVYAAAPAPYGK
jgi:hypothetical protein